jgi:phthiocerol/phenolphthiocerol synthesis type-I polyketide synthase E
VSATPEGIAVIGMSCRFPGASTIDAFWRNLRSGTESITFFSDEELAAAGVDVKQLRGATFVPAKGVLEAADGFDASFFGMSPREAALMDPQQRVFLETAWSALEHAGYDSHAYRGPIGVFAGSILSIYLLRNLWPNRNLIAAAGNFQSAIGNDPTFLATRTSYQLDLGGPSVSVGTACSTSLVAVHLACQSLLAYESDMALAGGVSVHVPLVGAYRYEDGGVLSPDGHCRPFDAAAQGTVSSDGAGVVVLKRVADAIADGDTIHAIIRGSAINNDGSLKVGYTAPSSAAEARVIAEAMAMADVTPESISLIEAHGAGTLLGDPIEVSALVDAFGNCGGKRAFCALGSVKSNIGHVDAAAGIAGLIKAVLALRHREIPATLHFETPNPALNLESTPFYVNRELRVLPRNGTPLRAGVSSFGIGGTNAHVVLEEAPPAEPAAEASRPFDLLLLSARTPAALDAATEQLAESLPEHPAALADVAFTLRHGRRAFPERRAVVCSDRDDASAALRERDPQRVVTGAAPATRPSLAFLFPGLGDHYAGMGWELYCTEGVFRDAIDRCAALLDGRLEGDLRDFLYPGRDWRNPVLEKAAKPSAGLDLRAMLGRRPKDAAAPPAENPTAAQPAIFVTEYALVQLLGSWGLVPEAMLGHSIGEFTAACVSGVLSIEDALALVAARAKLIQSNVGTGAMLAVPLTEEELRPFLGEGVSLGAINAARLCIASGEEAAVDALAARLSERGVSTQRLRSTHAYHSHMMEAIVAPLEAVLRTVTLRPPRIPYVSCITGTWITDAEATDPAYWARHLCRTVRFQSGLATLLEEPQRVLVETGPGQGLTAHAVAERARVAGRGTPIVPLMRWSYGLQPELFVLLRGIGQLWLTGAPLDTSRFLARDGQRRVPLPTYPFERQRYWIDPPAEGAAAMSSGRNPDVASWFYVPSWKPSAKPRMRTAAVPAAAVAASRRHPGAETAPGQPAGTPAVRNSWLLLADRYGVADALAAELRARGAEVAIARDGDDLGDITATEIVHLRSLHKHDDRAPSATRFDALQEHGYHSLMSLVQTLDLEGSTRLHIIANELHEVNGSERLVPELATLRAPALVAPQEHPGLTCRVIDVDLAPGDPRLVAQLVAQLLGELLGDAHEPTVAYRRGSRFLPVYERIELAETPTPFRQRGVYLITGGLGGVGMILARHLARTVQARLVLLGRSGVLPQSSREELEQLGAEVLVLRADVSNREEMERALATIDARFGTLHGVIHAAGSVGATTFREIRIATVEDSESQFVAKVRGTLVLDELLAGRPLDFVLLMSSLSAILGGLGFAAYTAANLFLDAFARWKNRGDGTRWTSVDWDSWRLADMRPVIAGLGATVSEFVMEPEEGAAAVERILHEGNLSQVAVSTGDLRARLRLWIERTPQDNTTPVTPHERPSLRTAYVAPRGELERELASIWQELFGVATVGVHDNFFELGGHSLLATQLNARLSSRLHVELSLAALLQTPTIADLALAILNHQAERVDPETLERMLAEVGDLSPEELQRMLDEENLTTGGTDE